MTELTTFSPIRDPSAASRTAVAARARTEQHPLRLNALPHSYFANAYSADHPARRWLTPVPAALVPARGRRLIACFNQAFDAFISASIRAGSSNRTLNA